MNPQVGGRPVYTVVKGQRMKLCSGASHPEPTYLPANDKYFYIYRNGKLKGKLTSQCRLCKLWSKAKVPHPVHGLVPIKEAQHWYVEVANRIGITEMSRRTGLSAAGISDVLHGRPKHVRKGNFRLVMLELVSIRRKNEFSAPPQYTKRAIRMANGYAATCAGCGGDLASYTYNCTTCSERRLKRRERK